MSVDITNGGLAGKYAVEYTEKLHDAILAYEEQKRIYGEVRAAYVKPGRDDVTAETRASNDPRLVKASGLAGWYRDEALMYGTAVIALSTWSEQ